MALIPISAPIAPNQSEIAAQAYWQAFTVLNEAAQSDPTLTKNVAFVEATQSIHALFTAAFVEGGGE